MFATVRNTVRASVAAAALLGAATAAQAGTTFEVLNRLGVDIVGFYVTEDHEQSWGSNALRDFPLADGNDLELEMRSDACVFDLGIVDAAGETYTLYDFDLCRHARLMLE